MQRSVDSAWRPSSIWHLTHWFPSTLVAGQHLPWHYIPVWMVITLPTLYSILIINGLIITIRQVFKPNSLHLNKSNFLYDFYFLALGLVPLLIIIIIKSTLYGGWRHLYFIYPPLVWFAMVALQKFTAEKQETTAALMRLNFKSLVLKITVLLLLTVS